ncbi:ferrous iron transporter B [Achromobacter deleyi]|uniref:ferrous iron transporter B n=1 Tax=Achromobacter deleyi TaxID=1353891 RepID=UPI00146696B3|nr:ferrous iron transporter B [Achromobacter deleyi]CAB3837859.1 Fe(2+) transporter FeoB [Achromobacter deleyi]
MADHALRLALVGNPNCGKTALFNQLTSGRQKVANYAGVTVDRKEGFFATPAGRRARILDLPGTYSLTAASADEKITQDVLQGRYPREVRPDLVVMVVDATNLRLHLRLLLEMRRLDLPMVVALNLSDQARRRGIDIDVPRLARHLGVPVVETVAVRRQGARALRELLDQPLAPQSPLPRAADPQAELRQILADTVRTPASATAVDDRIDRWTLHPVFGPLILALIMFLTFQAVYAIGKPLTDAIVDGIGSLGAWSTAALGDGPFKAMLREGLFGGLGTVLGFLPQILVLFLFILVLEESGYLPRAAFLLDQAMVAVGLTGRAFIPLLSSFACAIPSIVGTRSIPDRRDRLVTILVAPLMTCSARLPVYALLIGAFVPDVPVLGIFNLQGAVLFVLYAGGIVAALGVAYIGKRLRPAGQTAALLMELPAYRLPRWRDLGIGLWARAWLFLKKLTGVMLALTVLMWFIATFPGAPAGATGPAIEYSFANMLGQWMQPLFAPLGFNWQITLALIPAFAARESAVATLATIYSVAEGQEDTLGNVLAGNFPLASALSLMVWFAFAPQCMSTLAIIKRETGDWRNVALSFGYMFALAYAASFVTYRLAGWLL